MVVEALVLQPDPIVDLFMLTGVAALIVSAFCLATLVVTWLYSLLKFISRSASSERDAEVQSLNRFASKFLAWSLGTFLYCVVIVMLVIFLIRLIRSFI